MSKLLDPAITHQINDSFNIICIMACSYSFWVSMSLTFTEALPFLEQKYLAIAE